MGKQAQISFTLTAQQVREAVECYVALMLDPKTHDVAITMPTAGATVVATKRRVRKAKVAAVKAAA